MLSHIVSLISLTSFFLFFFNDTATTEIYTLSLHDALPISLATSPHPNPPPQAGEGVRALPRSEEHTSELQSLTNLVCRLLLEKKKKKKKNQNHEQGHNLKRRARDVGREPVHSRYPTQRRAH